MPRRSTSDGGGITAWQSHYPGLSSSYLILHQASKYFGVTRWQLGKMLGVPPGVSSVYRWGSRQGMSAMYLTRLLHLYQLLHQKVLNVRTFDGSTYWENYAPPEESI